MRKRQMLLFLVLCLGGLLLVACDKGDLGKYAKTPEEVEAIITETVSSTGSSVVILDTKEDREDGWESKTYEVKCGDVEGWISYGGKKGRHPEVFVFTKDIVVNKENHGQCQQDCIAIIVAGGKILDKAGLVEYLGTFSDKAENYTKLSVHFDQIVGDYLYQLSIYDDWDYTYGSSEKKLNMIFQIATLEDYQKDYEENKTQSRVDTTVAELKEMVAGNALNDDADYVVKGRLKAMRQDENGEWSGTLVDATGNVNVELSHNYLTVEEMAEEREHYIYCIPSRVLGDNYYIKESLPNRQ